VGIKFCCIALCIPFVLMLQLDSSCDTYAGSAFSLREAAIVNSSGQRINGRSASRSSPWPTRSRPMFSSAIQSPCYNGFRGTVAAPLFSSRRTPFSYNDNPPETVKAQCRPAATAVVSGKVGVLFAKKVALMLFSDHFSDQPL